MTALPLPTSVSNSDLHWAVGLLEGEGSFFGERSGERSSSNELRVTCQMTDLDVIERLHSILGGHVWHPNLSSNQVKLTHVWSTSTSDHAFRVMNLVRPFMGERRSAKIESVLTNYQARGHKRKQEQLSRNTQIIELFAAGESRYSIAATVGCCYGTVRNVISGRR